MSGHEPIHKTLNLSDKEIQRYLVNNPEFAKELAHTINKLEDERQKSKDIHNAMQGISARRSSFYWKVFGAYPVLFTEILKGNKYALIAFVIFILIIIATAVYRIIGLN